MATLPRDLSDLYLAPVVLAIDARIEELGRLDVSKLAVTVGLAGDRPEWSRSFREDGLIATIREGVDCHGWTFSWDVRGLRLSNSDRSVVLGIPPVLVEYLSATPQASTSS